MYGGSISSGWLRWIMEQHHFNFKTIYSKEIDAGNLKKKYDVIIFVSGAIPSLTSSERSNFRDTTRLKDIPCRIQISVGKNQCRHLNCRVKKIHGKRWFSCNNREKHQPGIPFKAASNRCSG